MGAFSSGFGVRRLDPQEPEDRCCLWLESVAGLGKAGCVSIAKYLQPSSGVVRGAPERNPDNSETGELSKVGDLLSWDAAAKVQLHDHSEQTEAVPELYPSDWLASAAC